MTAINTIRARYAAEVKRLAADLDALFIRDAFNPHALDDFLISISVDLANGTRFEDSQPPGEVRDQFTAELPWGDDNWRVILAGTDNTMPDEVEGDLPLIAAHVLADDLRAAIPYCTTETP